MHDGATATGGRDGTLTGQYALLAMRTDGESGAEAVTDRRTIRRFVVRTNGRFHLVRASDVDWFEASANYVLLHAGQSTHRVRITMQTLLEGLDPGVFLRIHKSVIVNVERIREIQPWFGGDYVALLNEGKQLRVSRTFARALLQPVHREALLRAVCATRPAHTTTASLSGEI